MQEQLKLVKNKLYSASKSLYFCQNMGGSGSREVHHHHTVYQVPPETQKVLEEQTQKLQEYEKDALDRHDPKLFEKNSKALMDTFVEQLPKLELTDIIEKKTGETHIGFIGQISSGKTSLINALFNKNLPIALGHCTDKCEIVHSENYNIIWDVCGQNDDFKFYDPKNLSFVKNLDKCVILFDNDIAMISNFLKVVHKINPDNMIIVRTKVDQYNKQHTRTIEEEKVLDKQKVKELLGIEIETYCISSHNIIDGKPGIHDWDALKEALGLN